MDITTKKLSANRTQATVIFSEEEVKKAENAVVEVLSKKVAISGFRKGHVPPDMARDKLSDQEIQEETVQKLVPDALQNIFKENKLSPIIRPRVELKETSPMTLMMTFVEEPETSMDLGKVRKEMKKHAKEEKTEKDPKENVEEIMISAITNHTKVDLADELLEEEVRNMLEGHIQYLSQYGVSLEDWLKQTGKALPDFVKELKGPAEKRLKVRFGVTSLIKKWDIKETDPKKTIEAIKNKILKV